LNKNRFWSQFVKQVTWHLDRGEKHLYLTFDDGPTRDITYWILDMLDRFDARATFFCLGRQMIKFPLPYEAILHRGHAVGNHSFSHLKGLYTNNRIFLEDIALAADLIKSNLFRPPYGLLSPAQFIRLKNKYQIVMWDVLSRDYNAQMDPEMIFNQLIRMIDKGSVIVMHDSVKAEKNMKAVLPGILEHYSSRGYSFHKIPVNRSH
jgi:peptidoglycan-N-acetylglucosamine deacetylase